MMQKNSQMILPGGNPKLPGKPIDPPANSSEDSQSRPLMMFLGWWKRLLWHRKNSSVEPDLNERVAIEAQVSDHLYPKRLKR
jgi:hypothetical protein